MNPPRATDRQYIDFLIGTPEVASACEAARVQSPDPKAPAHDAFSRLLARLEPDPETLWQEVRPLVRRADCILVVNDNVLDKPYAAKMGLLGHFWSGKHGRVVRGLKQCTEVERCQARLARSQRNHIGFALRAFVRLEWHRFHSGITWYEAKISIVRDAVRAYVCDPKYNLPQMATA